MTSDVIQMGTKREMFWNDYLVDTELTTACPQLNHPVLRGTVMWLDSPLEDHSVSYPCLVKTDKEYLLYYIAWHGGVEVSVSNVCVLRSKDGIEWERPNIGCHSYCGSKDNNIVIPATEFRDNAFVFYDTNPDCPPEQKFKCLADGLPEGPENVVPGMKRGLWYLYSADGIHWNRHSLVSVCGQFDTLNTAHWNGERYAAYIRNYHNIDMNGVTGKCTADGVVDINEHYAPKGNKNRGVRDIRVMYSEDFIHWTTPERIRFQDEDDIPLYTNNVIPDERAPHILIGFPTRYCERAAWTPNFDQLSGSAARKETIRRYEPRAGLAITDCLFMWSRDGMNWDRYREAFMTPGYEHPHNWVYGDCYPAYGFADTSDECLSMYTIDYHRSDGHAKPVNRHEIRKDGFACYTAGCKESVLVTKPLIFERAKLHLNFTTSAFGSIYVDVLDEAGNVLSGKSFEVFGDTIDREVYFDNGTDFSPFAGKPVRLRFTMRDAKLYSMKFE